MKESKDILNDLATVLAEKDLLIASLKQQIEEQKEEIERLKNIYSEFELGKKKEKFDISTKSIKHIYEMIKEPKTYEEGIRLLILVRKRGDRPSKIKALNILERICKEGNLTEKSAEAILNNEITINKNKLTQSMVCCLRDIYRCKLSEDINNKIIGFVIEIFSKTKNYENRRHFEINWPELIYDSKKFFKEIIILFTPEMRKKIEEKNYTNIRQIKENDKELYEFIFYKKSFSYHM